jgi:hypothetical protein
LVEAGWSRAPTFARDVRSSRSVCRPGIRDCPALDEVRADHDAGGVVHRHLDGAAKPFRSEFDVCHAAKLAPHAHRDQARAEAPVLRQYDWRTACLNPFEAEVTHAALAEHDLPLDLDLAGRYRQRPYLAAFMASS